MSNLDFTSECIRDTIVDWGDSLGASMIAAGMYFQTHIPYSRYYFKTNGPEFPSIRLKSVEIWFVPRPTSHGAVALLYLLTMAGSGHIVAQTEEIKEVLRLARKIEADDERYRDSAGAITRRILPGFVEHANRLIASNDDGFRCLDDTSFEK